MYPLRTNRNFWRIPLYSKHSCVDSQCTLNTCTLDKGFYPSSVSIADFSVNDPQTYRGKLIGLTNVVIPDTCIELLITDPLSRPLLVPVEFEQPPTLRHLLLTIREVYSNIYRIEEETATPTEMKIETDCECSENVLEFIQSLEDKTSDENDPVSLGDCSICYAPLEKKITLACNHTFHKTCLLFWVEKGNGETCPLCRSHLVSCTKCNNTRRVSFISEYTVLPHEYREDGMRNQTNGEYGIHTWDLEDLRIDELWYNRVLKMLQVVIAVNL
jgi:hypothetical protein